MIGAPEPTPVEMGATDAAAPAGPDLRSILGVLLRHWKGIALAPVVALLVTYGALQLIPPLYKSTAEILVVDPRVQIGEAGQRLSAFDVDNAAMSSELTMLQSKSLALQVASQLHLADEEERAKPSLFRWLAKHLGVAHDPDTAETPSGRLDAAAEALRRHIQVERIQLSYVLAVSVSARDPAGAQRLTDAVANAFLEDQRAMRSEALQRAMNWWTDRLVTLRRNVSETEARIEKLKLETGVSDGGINPALQKLTALHADVQLSSKLRELEPVLESNRKLYDAARAQLDAISRRVSLQEFGGRVITSATLPDGPSSPRRPLIYAVVLVISLAGGAAAAFVRESLDSGFRTAAALEQVTRYPVIGMIPAIGTKLRPPSRNTLLKLIVNGPHSQLSEVCRAARVTLGLANPKSAGTVILVTSAIPNEGKSVAAMLLAGSSALSGKKTLLIDCDVRQRSITRQFGFGRPGWNDVLKGKEEIAAATVTDQMTGLSIIPVGCPVNSAEALLDRPMHQLMAALREHYDCIVLDTGPLLGVADSLALAGLADKVLMVVEWGRTPRATVVEALKVFRLQGEPISGIMLNKVDYSRLRSYGYGYGGGYAYGYSYRALAKYFEGSTSNTAIAEQRPADEPAPKMIGQGLPLG